MEKKVVKFAVVGTNTITEWFLNGAKVVEGFKLQAIYSRTKEKGEAFARKYGVLKVYTNLEEMAKDQEIDAVYIASPNALHAEQSILFMQHGKHVLCEKAFASNLKEVEKMIEVAKSNNVVLMEAMKTTLFPNFKEIIKNIDKIGKVRKYFSSFCQYSSRYDKYKEGVILNAFKPELSNGALMDIGVYTIAPMVVLFGKPKEIKAMGYKLETGVDGSGTIAFKYEDMDATVMYSKISNSYVQSEIQGEKGSILIDRINSMNSVKIIYKDGTEEELTKKQYKDDMCYEIEEFIKINYML